jgi:adenylate cyclase, class 2
MAQEFETKVLDINVEEIVEKLKKRGAIKIKEVLFRRWVFDIDPNKDNWIRLRDEGDKITLTHKYKKSSKISETEETEVEVNNFERTAKILSQLPFKNKFYQENKRTLYKFKNIEFALDTWPGIPTYLEIEAKSEKKVLEGLEMLGLEGVGNWSVKNTYTHYDIDLHKIKILKF